MAQVAQFDFVDKVIFVNPVNSPKKSWENNTIRHDAASNFDRNLFPSNHHANIKIYSPRRFFPLKKFFPKLDIVENHLFYHVINRMNQGRPFILIINDPIKSVDYLLRKFQKRAGLSIFDFSDDFVEYFKDKTDCRRSICLKKINNYAGNADVVLTVNRHLKEKYGNLNKHISILKNATNYDNFSRKAYLPVDFLEKVQKLNRPIVGYSGGIRENRFDFKLLDVNYFLWISKTPF